jgi:hypothetical protein
MYLDKEARQMGRNPQPGTIRLAAAGLKESGLPFRLEAKVCVVAGD